MRWLKVTGLFVFVVVCSVSNMPQGPLLWAQQTPGASGWLAGGLSVGLTHFCGGDAAGMWDGGLGVVREACP